MGCESAAAVCADDNERAYHSLISLMLSSQTKDTMNFLVMTRLREWGLSVASVSAVPEDRLRELIYGVGFHNNKVKHIKASTEIIIDQHGGRVPATLDELLALPGVGPKMALIQMNVAVGQCVGISVDTHVHRISNQLGWTGDTATKQPEKTREALESWMPRDVWPHINLVMVGLGQEVQTEKTKLLRKCVACSDPPRALELMTKLGLDIDKEMKKAGLALSPLRS
ncbi:DNA glycosylase [Pavlovales sp. CCMP2436]|nr:DNA glycosylase [Pavlovales sp. CCMP2436]